MSGIRSSMIFPLLLLSLPTVAQIRMEPATDKPIEYSLPPRVVSSVPANGAVGVNPAIPEIRVTFDQDMEQGVYSFTGAQFRYYPKVRGEAIWLDSRTCALPVALAPGRFYRVAINTGGSRNFKSDNGLVAYQHVLAFTTEGASPLDIAALRPPRIVTLRPENGQSGVMPGLVNVSVVFDQAMRKEFSLVVVDKWKFPQFVGIGTWTADMRQLIFPVELIAQRQYVIGLNSLDNLEFQNDHGIPLEPLEWAFDTIR